TPASDVILVRGASPSGTLEVLVNGQLLGCFIGAGKVYVHGGAGNDQITIAASAGAIKAILYGDTGNDQVFGGIGLNFLDGGDGNDRLQGNASRDLIFGGGGVDELLGGQGE